ncbi:MAG: hypothetical protein P1V35_11305 [Planctomycetota bacterium]|nr:hypothetical protein [Planctomycetota bacterium]
MGCKAFTPHLVGLAKELENKPFHLLASYNQRGTPAQAKHEIFQNGMALLAPNVTVSMHANHSGVQGTGYVPYYMVFDHHGDLVYHHQGGPYHGGDGTAVLDRVRTMLEQVPVIYTGRIPFERHAELAQKLEKGKQLNKSLLALAAALGQDPNDAELARLQNGVESYKRIELSRVERLLGTDFNAGQAHLETLAKAFLGTPWEYDIQPLVKSVRTPKAQKFHGAASKSLAKALGELQKLKSIQGNGAQVLNPLDAEFRATNRKKLDAIIQSLDAIGDQGSATPAGKLSVQLLALLQ